MTFTNKAAREMKLRLGQMLGQAVEGMPWLGTFHSIGGRILRIHAELVQLKSNFTVLDVDDQIRLLKQLLASREHRRQALAGADAGRPDRRLEESRPDAGAGAVGRSRRFRQRQGRQALRQLSGAAEDPQRRRFRRLLLENIRLFREHPDVLRQYQNRFKFILVDEYQDTNVAQYLWLRLLSQAPSRTGTPLSAIIPGAIDIPVIANESASPVIPGRAEGSNSDMQSHVEEVRPDRMNLPELPGLRLRRIPE